MPLVMLKSNVKIPDSRKEEISLALSRIVAQATGKPEAYMMATIESADGAAFAGKAARVVFADVRAIGGLTQKVNGVITAGICALCKAELDVPEDAVYITFTEVAAANWGWNGKTFG